MFFFGEGLGLALMVALVMVLVSWLVSERKRNRRP
jgi:hypothetical protein